MVAKKKSKKKTGLTTKIFLALLLGIIGGIIFHYFVPNGLIRDDLLLDGAFYVVGNGFLRAMQMLVVPLVFSSLVCGSMSIGDTKQLGKVGLKTIIFYFVTTAIAITLALGIGYIVKPGVGLDVSTIDTVEVAVGESTSFADTLLNMIPTNPISAMADGVMLQIILFALLLGIVLAKLGEKVNVVAEFFQQFNDIMNEMTKLVLKFAPYGVFCLIMRTFAGMGMNAFLPLIKYISGVYLALIIQCVVVYMLLLKGFTGLNPVRFLKKFAPVMGFAFSTASSNATIPMSIETLEKKVGVSNRIASFTIPLGATINMDGTAIMQGVAVVFAAQAFGIELGVAGILTVIATATLASVGTAGVPGVGIITLTMVFESVGLPVAAIAMIMGIDRIVDMARTAVNITGDAVCTAIVAHQNDSLDREIYYSDDV